MSPEYEAVTAYVPTASDDSDSVAPPELFSVAVPRREDPFKNRIFPVGITPPIEVVVAVIATAWSTSTVFELTATTTCDVFGGGFVVPVLTSIAPMDGGSDRRTLEMSVGIPGMVIPAPISGLEADGVKLKLSSCDSADMGDAGCPANAGLEVLQVSPISNGNGAPLRANPGIEIMISNGPSIVCGIHLSMSGFRVEESWRNSFVVARVGIAQHNVILKHGCCTRAKVPGILARGIKRSCVITDERIVLH